MPMSQSSIADTATTVLAARSDRPGSCAYRRDAPAVELARKAMEAEPDDREDSSAIGLPRAGLVVQAGAGRGHEQGCQVRPAERARGRTLDRKAEAGEQRPVGPVAADGTASPPRHPDAAVRVHREPIGHDARLLAVDKRATARDGAAGRLEVERVEAAGAAVVEIHGPAVGAPADAVAIVRPVSTVLQLPS